MAAALLLALAIMLQIRAGAFNAEFGPDDSSHVVSGLVIYDYLTQGIFAPGGSASPIKFVTSFQSHYPLVGIGHWGPLYYGVEALWMLVFGTTRVALLLLSAVVTVIVALITGQVVAKRSGDTLGMAAAAALVLSGIFQKATASVMLDSAIALCCLLAALSYAGFAARVRSPGGGRGHALLFGVLAGAGLLIKGNAACLALLPPLFLLIGGRFDLARRWSFWLPLPIVALLAGPWTVLTYRVVAQGFRYRWGLDYSSVAVPANAAYLLAAFGPVVVALAIAGFIQTGLTAGRDRLYADPCSEADQDHTNIAMVALLVSVCVFQTVAPAAIQDRYLAPALPPLLIVAAHGLRVARRTLDSIVRPSWRRRAGLLLLAIVFLSATPSLWSATTPQPRSDLNEAASEIWRYRIPANPSVLIAADAAAEGAAVAELALTDPARPSLFAIRGSRLLGGGGYNNSDYQPRYTTAEQAMAAIDKYAIPFVLLRITPTGNKWQHLDQLNSARFMAPDRWELVWRSPESGTPVELYHIRGNGTRPANIDQLMALSAPQTLTNTAQANRPAVQPGL
jgi:hypothetical protein